MSPVPGQHSGNSVNSQQQRQPLGEGHEAAGGLWGFLSVLGPRPEGGGAERFGSPFGVRPWKVSCFILQASIAILDWSHHQCFPALL